MKILCALIVCASLAGCGDSDPLVGTWQGKSGLAVITWSFHSDQGWTSSVVATYPDTGCTETTNQIGTWKVDGSTLTITASSGTLAVSGCSKASDNQAEHPDPDLDTSPKSSSYSVSGDMLTDTPMGASSGLVLMRQ